MGENKHNETFEVTYNVTKSISLDYDQLKRTLLDYLRSGENEKLFLKQHKHIKNNITIYEKVTITIKEYIDNAPKHNNPRILVPEYDLLDFIDLHGHTDNELKEALNYYKGEIYPFTGLHRLITNISDILKKKENVSVIGTTVNGKFMSKVIRLISRHEIKQAMLIWLKSGSHDYSSFKLNHSNFDKIVITFDDFNNNYNEEIAMEIYDYFIERLDQNLTAKQYITLLAKVPERYAITNHTIM